MNQNKIDKVYTAAEITSFDDALDALETLTKPLTVLSAKDKSRVVKMPDGGEEFVANIQKTATLNSDLLPGKYDPVLLETDNALAKQLAVRIERLTVIADKLESTKLLVDSDRFATGLYLRRTLKENGKEDGLDAGLDEGLLRFLSRAGSNPAPAAPTTPQ